MVVRLEVCSDAATHELERFGFRHKRRCVRVLCLFGTEQLRDESWFGLEPHEDATLHVLQDMKWTVRVDVRTRAQ